MQNIPFSIVHGPKNFTGFIGDIWTEIEKTLGFESKISLATQYGGAPDAKGNWKGMVGMVHRNEVHIAVADFFPTPLRKNVVDFTSAISRTG